MLSGPIKARHALAVSILLCQIVGIIWWFPYLPMTDLPEHMLAAQVLTHYDAPASNYPAFFTRQFPWNPYSNYFLFVLLTDPLVGVRNATRLYLSIAFVLTMISFWWWIRMAAPGRDAQVIPATLLLFGLFFYIGLINFLFSAPFLFFSLVLSWKLLDRTRRSWALILGLAACLLIAYSSHIVTFGLCGLMVAGQALILFKGRRISRLLLPVAPSVCLLLIYSVTQARNDVAAITLSWNPLWERLAMLLYPFSIFHDSSDNRWVFDWPTVVLWALVMIMMIGARIAKPYAGQRPSMRAAWAIALMSLACTLLLPSNLSGGLGVALRGSYFAAFAGLALLPVEWDQLPFLRWAMVLVCAVSPALLAARAAVHTSEMRDLERVIAQIPPAKVIQPIITEPHNAALRTYPHQHAAAWYSYYKGGISPYLFTSWAAHFPVRSRRPFVPNAPGEWQMNRFRYEVHQSGTDYFLVRSGDERILADLREHVPLAAAAGQWRIFGPNPRR